MALQTGSGSASGDAATVDQVQGIFGSGQTITAKIRNGRATIANGGTSIAVTFSSTMGDTNYSVVVTPPSNIALSIGTKTATGFTITASAPVVGNQICEYMAIHD